MSYLRCPSCGQLCLRKGQQRKSPDEYRHANGCPLDDWNDGANESTEEE